MSNQQRGLMIVDGALPDRAIELAAFMDTLTSEPLEEGQDGPFAKMAIELRDTEDSAQRQDIFLAFAESSGLLLKASVADIEPAFNLLLFVLTRAPDFGILVPVLLSQLEVDTSSQSVTQLVVLAILGNLFSIMPEDARKFDVLLKILHASHASGTLGQLVPQLSKVAGWLDNWGVTSDQSATFYETALELLGSGYPLESRQLLLDANKIGCGVNLAKKLVVSALEDDTTYELEKISSIPAVKEALSMDRDLAIAFRAVASGDCAFLAETSYASNKKVLHKTQVISLANLVQTQTSLSIAKIPYEEIMKTVDIPQEDVEVLIIDAVRAGLIFGRMDQLAQVLHIEGSHIIPSELTMNDWKVIDGWLSSWLTSLESSRQKLTSTQQLWERLYV